MQSMVLNKKGQFFTLGAILVIALMFTSFEIFSTIHERSSVRERVNSMDIFLNSIENNLERQIYISGYRGIFLASQEASLNHKFIPNLDDFLQEAFFNGTVNGAPNSLLVGTTYSNITDSINVKASKINVRITLSNTNYTVTQTDPWHVRFTMISNFIMEDKSGLAEWNKTQNISALVPIENFKDPVFSEKTNGKISRDVKQTPYKLTAANFSSHFNGGYYYNNTDAPSYLMRIKGDLSPSPYGIESFVDKTDILVQAQSQEEAGSVPTYNAGDPNFIAENSIDYKFFDGNLDPGILATPSPESPSGYFKTDCEHAVIYNLTTSC